MKVNTPFLQVQTTESQADLSLVAQPTCLAAFAAAAIIALCLATTHVQCQLLQAHSGKTNKQSSNYSSVIGLASDSSV
jgi:hypothetical protein